MLETRKLLDGLRTVIMIPVQILDDFKQAEITIILRSEKHNFSPFSEKYVGSRVFVQ